MIQYKKTKLDNGIEIVGEIHPYGNAVSLGFGVRYGSRDEKNKDVHGLAHLIEHLVFKSTKKYNAFELVNSLEEKGGDINAFTCKEFTCFHSYGLKEDLPKAIDVLSQIVFYSNWKKSDFDLEKEVILQEIMMSHDNPEDYMFDDFTERFFGGSALSHPIFGNLDSVRNMSFKEAKDVFKKEYVPANVIISVAGNFDWDEFVKLISKASPNKSGDKSKRSYSRIKPKSFVHFEEKQIQQAHVIIGFPVNAIRDGIHYPVSLISNYLSGGMNSRLFQDLREKKGLCYAVSSSYGPNQQAGSFSLSGSTSPEKVFEFTTESLKILNEIKLKALSKKDLEKTKQQIRCGLLLGESDIDSRMHSLMYDKMFGRKYRSVADLVDAIMKITTKDMKDYVNKFFSLEKSSFYFMGNVSDQEKKKILKKVKGS